MLIYTSIFFLGFCSPSVTANFPTVFSLFYLFNGFPSIFFFFSASSHCFCITLILLGCILSIPSPGSYFFIFDFLYVTKSQPSSKLISHSLSAFSSPIFLCLYSFIKIHQQFKPDDIMIASFSAFLLQPYLSCLHYFKDKVL